MSKGYECVNLVHVCRKAWAELLDKPEDDFVNEALSIKHDYDRALRMEANYQRIYADQREIHRIAVENRKAEIRAELEPLSKREVAERTYNTSKYAYQQSKESMISTWLFTEGSRGIEPEYDAVKRIWDSMTDEEKSR